MATRNSIYIHGRTGRMGKAVENLLSEQWRCVETPLEADVIIDFSTPAALVSLLNKITSSPKPLVTGTTGLSADQQAKVRDYAGLMPTVQSGNMALGVTLLNLLVERAAAVLGEEFDAEIHETHHRDKKDAPSGTALMLGRSIAEARKTSFEDRAVFTRQGDTGARAPGQIGFSVTRAGAVIGQHQVSFSSSEETLTLSHQASDRSLFARGALKAAEWVKGQTPGLYAMRDVLQLTLD